MLRVLNYYLRMETYRNTHPSNGSGGNSKNVKELHDRRSEVSKGYFGKLWDGFNDQSVATRTLQAEWET